MQLRFTVAYEGTRFLGWQVQPGGPTVQAELERALAIALRAPGVRVRGAGRTDAGVHADGQVACAPLAAVPDDLRRLERGLNALLPDDVAVSELAVVDDAFDPRRHARRRAYAYRIWRASAPSPFWRRWAWHVPRALDVDAMARAAACLVGEHDFAAFRGADPADAGRTTVRRVFRSALHADGPLLVYEIEATAFLKHMVRNVVGTLVEVGLGTRAADEVAAVLASGDRTRAGATAPAVGLTLVAVRYDDAPP